MLSYLYFNDLGAILGVCGHLQWGQFNKIQISHFTKPEWQAHILFLIFLQLAVMLTIP